MIGLVGKVGVWVALLSAGWLTLTGMRGLLRPRPGMRRRLLVPVAGLVAGAVVAMIELQLGLLTNDFSIEYIARNHARSTPFPFNVATAWAALEGSIVLWGLVLAAFIWTVARRVVDGDRLGMGALGVMGLVAVFFIGMMATVADPFRTISPVPLDGPGPNPLLQNHLLMAIHPPLLYVGFVGFTVPFGFAISALLLGEGGVAWLERTRRWSLLAWSFLTAGILLGGWWSYEVLGWGGFWAWDPVENASFMPWLLATAFVHSAVVQLRRGMLQAWNFTLVIGTFALTIFGTFLTRSGVIGSVHSFTQSAVGPALLGFLALVVVGSLTILALRVHLMAQPPRLESLASREGVFLSNNLLLAVFTFMVLVGTVYPLILEAANGEQVSVGRPFFDRFGIPLSYGLLLAMGTGPAFPYRMARWRVLWPRLRSPFRAGLVAGAAAVLAGVRTPHVVAVVMLAVMTVAVSGRQMWVSAAKRAAGHGGGSMSRSILHLLGRDPAFWGGQISHAGVALAAVAIALYGNLAVNAEAPLDLGSSTDFAGYTLTYNDFFSRTEPNKTVIGARVAVYRDGQLLEFLEPSVNRYPNLTQAVGTPAVRTGLTQDLYLSLRSIDSERIDLEMKVFPYMYLLWTGGLIAAAGGLWARRRPTGRARPIGKQVREIGRHDVAPVG
ncbi:MAG: heme lyase CcmF/NrfE family subunit [Acidimicrobiia bacterium]